MDFTVFVLLEPSGSCPPAQPASAGPEAPLVPMCQKKERTSVTASWVICFPCCCLDYPPNPHYLHPKWVSGCQKLGRRSMNPEAIPHTCCLLRAKSADAMKHCKHMPAHTYTRISAHRHVLYIHKHAHIHTQIHTCTCVPSPAAPLFSLYYAQAYLIVSNQV